MGWYLLFAFHLPSTPSQISLNYMLKFPFFTPFSLKRLGEIEGRGRIG